MKFWISKDYDGEINLSLREPKKLLAEKEDSDVGDSYYFLEITGQHIQLDSSPIPLEINQWIEVELLVEKVKSSELKYNQKDMKYWGLVGNYTGFLETLKDLVTEDIQVAIQTKIEELQNEFEKEFGFPPPESNFKKEFLTLKGWKISLDNNWEYLDVEKEVQA